LREYRERILAQEGEQMARMAKRWYGVEKRLWGDYLSLAREVEEKVRLGETVSASKLYQMERYKSLLGQTMVETHKYQLWSADLIERRQMDLASMGVKDAQKLIEASYLDAGSVIGAFNRLPVEAVEMMMGYASNGMPLYELLFESYADTVEDLTDILIESIAKGVHARKSARLMADKMAGNLQRALVVARTEQIRAYRRASTEQMKESGVVEGWYWRCAKQSRTCMACLAMDDGSVHDLDEDLNDHPNGRCFKQPAIIGLEKPEMQGGKAFFESLDEETQRKMMGDEMFEAWKGGRIDFGGLAKKVQSDEWGTHVVRASLKDLGVEKVVDAVEGGGMAERLGDALDVTVKGRLGKQINEMIDIIEDVHGVSGLPKIPIKQSYGERTLGQFVYGKKGAKEIKVSIKSNAPMMTTAHEIGHFIDYQGMGGGKWATFDLGKESPLYNWAKAMEKSEAYKTLKEIQKTGMLTMVENNVLISHPVANNSISYYLDNQELWARSYAQYIAKKSNNPSMLKELYGKQKQKYGIPTQWSDADFLEIEKAIDGVLEAMKWLK
jgi:hypothetical protein